MGPSRQLVFMAMGRMGKAAKVASGQIAALIATKRNQPTAKSLVGCDVC